MLNSIVLSDFSQEKVMKTDLDLQDLLLLHYILIANAEPKMVHATFDNSEYVWLSHDKIIEDIPILRISKDGLQFRLRKLRKNGYIDSKTVSQHGKGSMSYYRCLQPVFDLMRVEKNDVALKNSGSVALKNSGSNNKLIDNKLNNLLLDKSNNKLNISVFKENTQLFNSKTNIFKEVIDYLNLKTSCNYRYTTQDTQKLIKSKLKDGYTLDDFKKVIDNKCSEWLNNKDMEKYLRPQTLFGPKFENYLNQKSNYQNINTHPGGESSQEAIEQQAEKNKARGIKWRY